MLPMPTHIHTDMLTFTCIYMSICIHLSTYFYHIHIDMITST